MIPTLSHLPPSNHIFYSVATLMRCDITISLHHSGPASLFILRSIQPRARSRLGKGTLRSYTSHLSPSPLCRQPAIFASVPKDNITTSNFSRGVYLKSVFPSKAASRLNIHSMSKAGVPAPHGAASTPVPTLSTVEASKRAAAYKAVEDHFDPSYRYVGIGSGSTVVYVVEAIVAQGPEITSKMRFIPTGE